jgi:hypothetical protein
MDAVMKHFGRLSPAHAKAYGEQIQIRDECLTALQIQNPYREQLN